MAFGQPSGPPASAKQVRELLELLQQAGHADFRDARGPMGFTQRQAGGKFTWDEADGFIEQLRSEAELADSLPPEAGAPAEVPPPPPTPTPTRMVTPDRRKSATDRGLRSYPSEMLAAELQRRGWVVMEP